jgi:hypothetical protein
MAILLKSLSLPKKFSIRCRHSYTSASIGNFRVRRLPRNALSSGGYSPLHATGAHQLRRRREAILEREAALRLFVGIARRGMDARRDLRLVEIRE